jgi:hypothetical protein
MQLLVVMQLARRTGDRYRDLSDDLRDSVVDWLNRREAPAHYVHLVEDIATLESDETNLILGDTMPLGLRIQP